MNVNFTDLQHKLEIKCFLHPMTTECSYGHEKVCSNIIQLKKIQINNSFFWVICLIKKYPVFIIV